MPKRQEDLRVIETTDWASDSYILPRDFTPREGQVVDKNALWVGKHFLRHTRLNGDIPFTVISLRPETHEMVVFYESQEGDYLILDTVKLSEFGVEPDRDSGLMHSQNYLTVDTNPRENRALRIADHDENGRVQQLQVLCLVAAAEAKSVNDTIKYLRELRWSLSWNNGTIEDLGINIEDIQTILTSTMVDANLNEFGYYVFETLREALIKNFPTRKLLEERED